MSEEEKEWRNRFSELAERAYARGRYTFTDFLSPAEASVLYADERSLAYAGISLWGGFIGAERIVARFGNCAYEEDFPVSTVKILPVNRKFAEELTHRDYLGALVNLRIDRCTLGDIVLFGGADGGAYLYCLSRIAAFVAENLTRVKHTDVKCGILSERERKNLLSGEGSPDGAAGEEKKGGTFFLSSLRADCAVAAAYKLSRGDAEKYFDAERVFLNGRVCTRPSREIAEGDIVAVRGKGRFTLTEIVGESKKGRLRCRIEIS